MCLDRVSWPGISEGNLGSNTANFLSVSHGNGVLLLKERICFRNLFGSFFLTWQANHMS